MEHFTQQIGGISTKVQEIDSLDSQIFLKSINQTLIGSGITNLSGQSHALMESHIPKAYTASRDKISMDDLYSVRDEVSRDLQIALQLLKDGERYLNEALKYLEADELIKSDNSIQSFASLLQELFCCRNLGDGFGEIINALLNSFQNSEGDLLNRTQIKKICDAISVLKNEPFIQFEKALAYVDDLEQEGFIVEPKEFPYLADLLINNE